MEHQGKVLVKVWAKQYETSHPLEDAEIIDIPTGERWRTNADGYAQLYVEPGRTLTLKFNKGSFPSVQTATVTVPAGGLDGEDREITLQVPGNLLYKALRLAIGKPRKGTHHVVTTVSAAGKNMHDDLGESGVTVTLRSTDGRQSFDEGMYLGNIFGKTEWLRPIAAARLPFLKSFRHKSTSHDGGVIFRNIPPGDYILEARKTDAQGGSMVFKTARLSILPGSPELINVSPPHSPQVLLKPGH